MGISEYWRSMERKRLTDPALIEKILEDRIRLLVDEAIGQSPIDVSCKFIGRSELAVLVDNVRTPLEEFLLHHCEPETVQEYQKGIEYAMGRRIKSLVESAIDQPIEQVSMSRKTETRWMGIFVLL